MVSPLDVEKSIEVAELVINVGTSLELSRRIDLDKNHDYRGVESFLSGFGQVYPTKIKFCYVGHYGFNNSGSDNSNTGLIVVRISQYDEESGDEVSSMEIYAPFTGYETILFNESDLKLTLKRWQPDN